MRLHRISLVVVATLLVTGAAHGKPPGLQQQALARLGHLDRAYTTTTTDTWQRHTPNGTRTYRHTNTIRVDTSRPLISIGRLKLLHWNISKEQAIQRLAQGKPVRFAIRSQHVTSGGEPLIHSLLIGPKLTTTSLSSMLRWSKSAESFMARRVAHGQLQLPLE